MHILDLPAEMVRMFLHTLDPASFYLCLQTNKLFREHALASSALMADQISRVPGPPVLGATNSDAAALLTIFGKRAAQHLRNGTSRMTDLHRWRAPCDVDRKKSFIMCWTNYLNSGISESQQLVSPGPSTNELAFVQVDRYETIKVYFIERRLHDRDCLQFCHLIPLEAAASHLRATPEHTIQVVRVAHVPVSSANYDDITPGVRIAVLYHLLENSGKVAKSKVLVFCLHPEFGPLVVNLFDLQADDMDKVIAMKVGLKCNLVVVYAVRYSTELLGYRVVKYANARDEQSLEYTTVQHTHFIPPLLPTRTPSLGDRLGDLEIRIDTIEFYPTKYPMTQWIVHDEEFGSVEGLEHQDTLLPDTVMFFDKPSLGRTIAHRHYHEIIDPTFSTEEETCFNAALELVISRDHSYTQHVRKGAYILKATHHPHTCIKFLPHLHYSRLRYTYVAVFDKMFDLDNLSNLGLKVAVSPGAHRIAIASWKSVKVWSFDPSAFLDPAYSLNDETSGEGDYAFSDHCGQQFYDCDDWWSGCLVLEPVELPSAGIVFDLQFRTEDELWGWCDGSVVRWSFGTGAQGKREQWDLETISERNIRNVSIK